MIKRIITAGVLALAIASNFINEEVYAEPQYNVGLEIETFNIPINWVEPGDEVELRVKIKNNPGFTYLSFLNNSTGVSISSCSPFGTLSNHTIISILSFHLLKL